MYYPKSQIIPNQYTEGNKLVYASSKIYYTGYYHVLSNGSFFTGKNPNDGTPQLLVFPDEALPRPESFISSGNLLDNTGDFSFDQTGTEYDTIRLKNNIQPPPASLLEPKYTEPSPLYPSFTRYFVKRTNNSVFIEINKDTYNNIVNKNLKWNWSVYIPFEMPWTTGGSFKSEIAKINKDMVLLTEQRLKLYGFSNYITNYTEFAI